MCPAEEPHGVAVVGGPRVRVGDGVGEEGEEPLGGLIALVCNDGGEDEAALPVVRAPGFTAIASSCVIVRASLSIHVG